MNMTSLPALDALEKTELIETDAVVIGAGPCGLFAVFELGLSTSRRMSSTFSTGPADSAPSSIPKSPSTTCRRCRWSRARS